MKLVWGTGILMVWMSAACIAAPGGAPSSVPEETISFVVVSNGVKIGVGSLSYKASVARLSVAAMGIRDQDTVTGTLSDARPGLVERNVKVFGRREVIREEYAADGKSVRLIKTVDGKPVPDQHLRSDKVFQNVLLVLYQIRQDKDLAPGKEYLLNLPTQSFRLVVKDKRKVRVPLGVREVFYIESVPKKYRIWLGTDPRHIPLRIQGVLPAGMVYLAASGIDPK